jgi:hypothetical protein
VEITVRCDTHDYLGLDSGQPITPYRLASLVAMTRPLAMRSLVIRILALSSLTLPALFAPATLAAQTVPTSATVVCVPGIPACGSLRFTFFTAAQMSLNSLFLSLTSGAFTFEQPFGSGNPGVYSAVDAFGPFGGSTTIGVGANSVFIDFLGENGFGLEMDPVGGAFIDFGVVNAGVVDASAVNFTYSGFGVENGSPVSIHGQIPPVTATPEPATLALLATGFAATAAARRRRRESAA